MTEDATTQTETEAPAPSIETPAAPEVAPVEPAVEPAAEPAPETIPEGPVSKREARQQVREDAKAATPPAEPAEPETPPETPPEPGTETPPEPTAAEPAAAPAEPAPPIQIQIPATHPATRGHESTITVATPEEEQVVRALINGTYHRRSDVETRDATIAELQDKLARHEAGQTAQEKWQKSPQYQAARDRFFQLKDLEEQGSVAEGTASEYWKGAAMELSRLEQTEYEQRRQAIQNEAYAREAAEWKGEAWQRASRLAEPIRTLPEFGQWFESATQSFNAELELGHYPDLAQIANPYDRREALHKAFTDFFQARLVREPSVRAAYDRMKKLAKEQQAAGPKPAADTRTAEQIAKEAVEKFKKDAADKRRGGPPHPMGALTGVGTDRVPSAPSGDETPPAEQSTHAFRRSQRQAAREDARRRLSG